MSDLLPDERRQAARDYLEELKTRRIDPAGGMFLDTAWSLAIRKNFSPRVGISSILNSGWHYKDDNPQIRNVNTLMRDLNDEDFDVFILLVEKEAEFRNARHNR